MMSRNQCEKSKRFLSLIIMTTLLGVPAHAKLIIEAGDTQFYSQVSQEIAKMREGARGLACQILIQRIEEADATVTIKEVTSDEKTWHPNDRRGTRSHVVPGDTRIQGAARSTPTSSTLYLHPSRIDPALSLFKLGTFVQQLAASADLARGEFSGDYKVREKRATFFVNGWREALKLPLVPTSDNVPTPEYQQALQSNLINEENTGRFPILEPLNN